MCLCYTSGLCCSSHTSFFFLIYLLQVTGPLQVIPRVGEPDTRRTPCGDQGPSSREAA